MGCGIANRQNVRRGSEDIHAVTFPVDGCRSLVRNVLSSGSRGGRTQHQKTTCRFRQNVRIGNPWDIYMCSTCKHSWAFLHRFFTYLYTFQVIEWSRMVSSTFQGIMAKLSTFFFLTAYVSVQVSSISVTDIQGIAYQSPLVGQTINNLTALVTAKV